MYEGNRDRPQDLAFTPSPPPRRSTILVTPLAVTVIAFVTMTLAAGFDQQGPPSAGPGIALAGTVGINRHADGIGDGLRGRAPARARSPAGRAASCSSRPTAAR